MELSAKVVDAPAKLRATLLHELCHVAAWLLPPHVVRSLLGAVLYRLGSDMSNPVCGRMAVATTCGATVTGQCVMRPLEPCHPELP